jgi:hypothetical protein
MHPFVNYDYQTLTETVNAGGLQVVSRHVAACAAALAELWPYGPTHLAAHPDLSTYSPTTYPLKYLTPQSHSLTADIHTSGATTSAQPAPISLHTSFNCRLTNPTSICTLPTHTRPDAAPPTGPRLRRGPMRHRTGDDLEDHGKDATHSRKDTISPIETQILTNNTGNKQSHTNTPTTRPKINNTTARRRLANGNGPTRADLIVMAPNPRP